MKFLLTVLAILYFTGIGCEAGNNSSQNRPYFLGSFFTITHKGTDVEPVYAYLLPFENYSDTLIETNFNIYKLRPLECLIVKKSQFLNLKIRLGKGGTSDENVFACGNSSKCPAQHYEVIDLGEPIKAWPPTTWFNTDEFNLIPVKEPNQSESCTMIEEWMEAKLKPNQALKKDLIAN